jgi:hypothetical protein
MSFTRRGNLPQTCEADVGHAVTRADRRKTPDHVRLEPGLLDEPGGKRVVRAHQDQRLVA